MVVEAAMLSFPEFNTIKLSVCLFFSLQTLLLFSDLRSGLQSWVKLALKNNTNTLLVSFCFSGQSFSDHIGDLDVLDSLFFFLATIGAAVVLFVKGLASLVLILLSSLFRCAQQI